MRKTDHVVTYDGVAMCISDAVRRSGTVVDVSTVIGRVNMGWPLQLALWRPVQTKRGKWKPSLRALPEALR
jgi:hypothetical protein